MSKIGLKEMILNLRQELMAARTEGSQEELRFLVEDIEVELEVLATKEGTAGGKVDFWVYTADLHGKLAEASRQKLKLRLKPQTLTGDLEVSRLDSK